MAVIKQIVMDKIAGDLPFEIDTDDAKGLEEANARFKELTGKGFLAYAPGDNGSPGTHLREFDSTQEKTIFVPRRVGG